MASKKKLTADLAPQEDPKAPLDSALLLKVAGPVLRDLEDDLLERADGSIGVTTALKARHAAEKKAERTADNYETWRRSFIEQVAAAWFLSVVYVRTLEDRRLIERNRIGGEGALDSQRSFFALAPSLSERDYLLTVFRELSLLPAASDLFDSKHNPVWLLGPSAEGARKLLALFRMGSDIHPAFRFGGDTRFLGDLYQDLSENVRKRYALLQTPRFVESYILDKTLEPAIRKFGLNDATLIDPTCGSGHFLLGAFERLLDRRLATEPGVDARQAALKAIDAVAGTDINPYAISIARFRLTLAFLERAQYQKLKDAPKLPLHLAVADSLLHNPQKGLEQKGKTSDLFAQVLLGEQKGTSLAAWEGEIFQLEDPKATEDVLGSLDEPKRYAAVVGNPPYITVKDAVLRDRYRAMYSTAFREYSLAVPFKERFFQLAREAGHVGMITANSFMKREFGTKVIEAYLPTVNLTSIVNTSGAYIPGHGTPTVLLFGTAERPILGTVHTILASRGEPATPDDPEQGLVWRSIADHGDEVGFENEYISVTETQRAVLGVHPWSLGGGGAADLKALLEERSASRLGELVDVIGFSVITGEDNVLMGPSEALSRAGIPGHLQRRNVIGEEVRDWSISSGDFCIWPNNEVGERLPEADLGPVLKYLWPFRAPLKGRKAFGEPIESKGIPWWALREVYSARMRTPLTIAFAFVATHNHFVLDRGGKVFNRSAPIIKLPESATEDDHYALLAYLNSSTACFWMKQVCHNKTNASQKHTTDPARAAHEFSGTALEALPVFPAPPAAVAAARELSLLGHKRSEWLSGARFHEALPACSTIEEVNALLSRGWAEYDSATARAVFLQEELDWAFYFAAGLVQEPPPAIDPRAHASLGQRPFEVEQGYQDGVSGEAPNKRQSTEDAAPAHWIARKNALTGSLAIVENRAFKRFWRETERNIEQAEFRGQLPRTWLEAAASQAIEAALSSSAKVCGPVDVSQSSTLLTLAATFLGHSPLSLTSNLMATDAVPFLDAWTYTPSGYEKRQAWVTTWQAQRAEDLGQPSSPGVPPTYSQGSRGKSRDFARDGYWKLRGELDVPKERFISYPGCESDEDGEPVYGWAGWNHRQRAVALATLYTDRKNNEGWGKERLQPMLAGMLELMFWLELWHSEPDAEFDGAIPAVQFREFLDAECAEHGFTYDDLRAWRPPEKQRAAKKTQAKTVKPDPGVDS